MLLIGVAIDLGIDAAGSIDRCANLARVILEVAETREWASRSVDLTDVARGPAIVDWIVRWLS